MDIMTHAKFHFNQLILTLIFGIWASEPPPRAWRTTEKAGPDRANPSCTKPFGTHTFYQGGGGGSSRPPSYLKNRCPHESEILQGIRDTFESLRNVKVVYIVFTWLP